tara:strand:+ start:6399 stop:9659 length:3261 start_codon:yes stop_codon:yes gene_type:complete
MAISNRDRIGKTLDILRDGLLPFLSSQFDEKLGSNWKSELPYNFKNLNDINVLLKLFMEHWRNIFKKILSDSDRAYVSEILESRHKWAHSEAMSSDDVDRYLDTAIRFCKNINAVDEAESIRVIREELRQQVFLERARHRSNYKPSILNKYQAGLKPWREVIVPHRDVVNGTYQQAQFAANLDDVQRGVASSEYGDPVEFYKRTYITDGLKDLLSIALKRFNNLGGDPVIELQTNFGGGKTHSMLSLFHLCSGVSLDKLPGIDELCSELGINNIPKASRAVLVGTAFAPAKVDTKNDGTKVHTLWGELAWQLGGKEGYQQIAASDIQKVAPGTRELTNLFKTYGPCLILIDEWVAYARNLVSNSNLPAGTFDAQLTFAQELTESVKQVPNALLLISVPQSRNEIGGSDGEIACDGLKNVVTRIAKQWRPASGTESFEIVRRRLFEPIKNKEDGAFRDSVIRAYCDMYNLEKADFPEDTRGSRYRDLMTSAYPIHPDLFNKLYEEWSTLDRFQRTRGVLRLLALTIESLWSGNSKDLLIMPSSIPLDNNDVKNELVRFLDNQWEPIISQDVDGSESIPSSIDRENPNFGKVSACKRVARTLYMGTAPGSERQQKGINDQKVKLGCVMPGEPIPVFGDALRKLSDRGRYIQQDGDRYWIDTSPNLNRTAEDYKLSYLRENEDLIFELNLLIQKEGKKRAGFSGIHAGQITNNEIPDTTNTRLILLAAQYTHRKGDEESKAIRWVRECLINKGSVPRKYLNTMVFLAADEKNLNNLLIALAEKKAWQKIKDEKINLNLTIAQDIQTDQKIAQAINTINIRLPETWSHLIVPFQEKPGFNEFNIEEKQINSGIGSLAERAFQKCIQQEYIYQDIGARIIRDKLNNFLWLEKNHINVSQLIDWCQQYLYLPRVSSHEVIINALQNARAALIGEKTFYLADSYDELANRYEGLRPQFQSSYPPTLNSFIVKNNIAEAQLKEVIDQPNVPVINEGNNTSITIDPTKDNSEGLPKPKTNPTNFKGSLKLDPNDASLKTSKFMSEVMSHLQALPGSEIDITLDIHVKNKDGIDKQTARIILENSITLEVDNPEIY